LGIKCVLIFSKAAPFFETDEIALFKELAAEDIDCILFLNKELEPFDPYEAYEKAELTDKYTSTLNVMAWNSRKIYLTS